MHLRCDRYARLLVRMAHAMEESGTDADKDVATVLIAQAAHHADISRTLGDLICALVDAGSPMRLTVVKGGAQ